MVAEDFRAAALAAVAAERFKLGLLRSYATLLLTSITDGALCKKNDK